MYGELVFVVVAQMRFEWYIGVIGFEANCFVYRSCDWKSVITSDDVEEFEMVRVVCRCPLQRLKPL